MKTEIATKFKKIENGTIPEGWDAKELKKFLDFIKKSLDELYNNDIDLFANNLCERCLVFRFAHYLQNDFGREYFVDCDYNSSCYYDEQLKRWVRRNGKPIPNQKNGKIKKRFIDVIIHKRGFDNSDLICFEIKKWNNCTRKGIKKDENNLKVLTTYYGYSFGFHIILGKVKNKIKVKVFKGDKIVDIKLFQNNT